MGIEPTSSAWEAEVLPLNYTRRMLAVRRFYSLPARRVTAVSAGSLADCDRITHISGPVKLKYVIQGGINHRRLVG